MSAGWSDVPMAQRIRLARPAQRIPPRLETGAAAFACVSSFLCLACHVAAGPKWGNPKMGQALLNGFPMTKTGGPVPLVV